MILQFHFNLFGIIQQRSLFGSKLIEWSIKIAPSQHKLLTHSHTVLFRAEQIHKIFSIENIWEKG